MHASPRPRTSREQARPGARLIARRGLTAAACALAAFGASAAVAAPAHAYDITKFEAGTLTDPDNDTSYFQQAGGRPPFGVTDFVFATDGQGEPVGNTKTIRVDIPAGLTPDPAAYPTCTDAQLSAKACPVESQIGVQRLTIRGDITLLGRQTVDVRVPLYNMARLTGQVARFAFNPAQAPGSELLAGDKSPIQIIGGVRSDDNGLFFTISGLPTNPALVRSKLVFWGVPGAASHDAERTQAKTDIPAIPAATPIAGALAHQTSGGNVAVAAKDVAFLSMPTSCAGVQTSRLATTSTAGDARSASYTTPVGVEGCGAVPFGPTTTLGPAQISRDSPTGLDVGLRVPQTRAAGSLATSHVRNVSLTLPEGSTISPSAANGLQTCSDAQFRRGSADPVACPAASRVGSVTVGTPVLDAPLTGSLYLGDPLPGDRYRLLISAEGPGFTVRLVGSVRPDPVTGRLTTVVENAPQLPFSSLDLHFDDGPRAVIATPQTCGTVQSVASIAPWSGTAAATPAAVQDVVGCTGFPFEPGFSVAASPQAGAFAPFSTTFTRPDGNRFLQKIAVGLPPGLIARIKGVARCSDAQIAAEACPEASRIGTASTLAGPGPAPYPLSGPVYLTNAYGGGQFGFVTIIRAIAGPYDLGNVVVRQAVSIDPEDSHVTVTSDPLPQIKEGVQLRLRSLTFAVDRKGFARNPTSCGTKQVGSTLAAPDGTAAQRSAPVAFTGCDKEKFAPKLQLAFTGRREMRKGGHPGVQATAAQADGQAGIRSTSVALPKSVALAAANAKGLCETQAALEDKCPAASIVGSATATTSILEKQLKGPVYFVKGQRTTASGKVVATLPTLYVKLQGEATIHLRAVTAVNRNRLVTTFPSLPDAPLSKFTLSIASGKNGIIEAVQSICGRKNVGSARFVGHNGKKAPTQAPRITTACAKSPGLRVRSAKRSGRRVTVTGTIAKASKARVRVALRCGRTTLRASVAPKKGRWSTKVALKGACATAKRGTLGASVRAQGKLGAQTVKTRTVKLG
ncbi:hypothetical protein [Patulibacter sp.]|uniref:hypothetical protein n=1 Tax=Patulibacter sp. TaxID=1912859 RepID=UPI00271AA0DE|nr:hypothetical protein [Patulibacter sp.]MDO9410287.1 hypothetical protein [Patulibacter sp.]